MEPDEFPPEPGSLSDLTTKFLAGVEQRLADLSPDQLDAVVDSIFHQDAQAQIDPKTRAAQQLAGYVGRNKGTVDTAAASPPDAPANDSGPKRIATATSGSGLQSGASHPTQLTSKKTQAAHAFRNHR